ncbi:MBL fold metallo-hydrolase [Patescibacteria group bacterium]|nr:MBL fold metallo-hydrolase [Patescibacteria group bacterium]
MHEQKSAQKTKLIWVLKALSILLIAASVISVMIAYSRSKKDAVVAFLDVGQGDAIYIRSSDTDILIDGGATADVIEKLSKEMPFFDKTIELMVMTHADADHAVGLVEVMKRYEVLKVIESGITCHKELCQEWERIIDEKGIDREFVYAGKEYVLPEGRLTVVHPIVSHAGMTVDDMNEASVVTCLTLRGKSFLLTGDLGVENERKLVEQDNGGLCMDALALKAGHHGSKHSSSEEIIEYTNPEYTIISAGKDNSFGHPHYEVITRFSEYTIPLIETAKSGTIRFVLAEDGSYEIKTDR